MNEDKKAPQMNEHMNIMLAKEGNPEAFRQLYDRHGDRIYRIAYRQTGSRADAEDIMQDTFIKAFKSLRTFRFSPEHTFSSWINTICLNCALDHFRKQRRKHRHDQLSLSDMPQELPSANPSPEDSTEQKQVGESIRRALSILSPKQRLVFEMRFTQHMDIKDIAQTLRCSQSNVKTQIFRAQRKLRKILEPVWGKP
ncbi:MAG: sigma-70 family RNA polymerase sigma factor [Candidatus Aminicenantes bacterium]|nr:sigma-70 family RNA polymerase sigma factor [Candidatus Aminicenantes bacterium]